MVRDPKTIERSAQAQAQALVLVDRNDALIKARAARIPMPLIGGSAEQLLDTMGRYAQAGLDEFVVPDRLLGTGNRRRDAMDLLVEQVVGPLR